MSRIVPRVFSSNKDEAHKTTHTNTQAFLEANKKFTLLPAGPVFLQLAGGAPH